MGLVETSGKGAQTGFMIFFKIVSQEDCTVRYRFGSVLVSASEGLPSCWTGDRLRSSTVQRVAPHRVADGL